MADLFKDMNVLQMIVGVGVLIISGKFSWDKLTPLIKNFVSPGPNPNVITIDPNNPNVINLPPTFPITPISPTQPVAPITNIQAPGPFVQMLPSLITMVVKLFSAQAFAGPTESNRHERALATTLAESATMLDSPDDFDAWHRLHKRVCLQCKEKEPKVIDN